MDATAPVVTGSASVTVTSPSTTVSSYRADETVATWTFSETDSALFDIASGVVTFESAQSVSEFSRDLFVYRKNLDQTKHRIINLSGEKVRLALT